MQMLDWFLTMLFGVWVGAIAIAMAVVLSRVGVVAAYVTMPEEFVETLTFIIGGLLLTGGALSLCWAWAYKTTN
jgi:hypothetical protein